MVLPEKAASERPLEDVAVYGLQKRTGERIGRPWIVRWALDGRQRSRSFRTKAEADRYRSGLLLAQQHGERFDPETGEPLSWQPAEAEMQVHDWAKRWVGEQWDEWAPRTRTSAVEALARFIPLVVTTSAGPAPDGLSRFLAAWLRADHESNDEFGDESEDERCDEWLRRSVLPLDRLTRSLLADVDRQLGVGRRGQALSAASAGRYRKVAKSCIRRAVELEVLDTDPWPLAPKGRSQRKAVKTSKAVNVRQLPSPAAMREILAAIVSHQPASRMYRVMTAVAYFGGLRPSEVVMLRAGALDLPKKGWGRIEVTEADVDFDEPGEPKTGPRSVPIPPELVEILREWLEAGSFGERDLLFRTRNDKRPTLSNWGRAIHRACRQTDNPPMRIYDCRHAAATTWLRAGVPLGEVAKRMGHGVETLVSTYVGALDGDEAMSNERIESSLRA